MNLHVPFRAAVAAVVTAVFGAWALPDHAVGASVAFTALFMALSVFLARRPRSVSAYLYGGLGLLLVAMFAVRSAPWLLLVDLLVATGLGAASIVDARTWSAPLLSAASLLLAAPKAAWRMLQPVAAPLKGATPERLRPILRGLGGATLLVLVFAPLFLSADAAFAHLAGDVFLPSFDATLIPARAVVALVTLTIVGCYVLVAVSEPSEKVASPWARGTRQLPRTEWTIALGTLNGLFIAFVLVQLTVLFGDRSHVLETAGVTYAEYARQGFFQLLAVAALVLAVIAVTVRWAKLDGLSDRRVLQALLGSLCVLTLVILASALKRLMLYEAEFGYTRLRVSVHASIVWIAVIFVFVLLAGAAWRGSWLPRAVLVFTGVALLTFNLIDPDAKVAELNVARYADTGKIDRGYLSVLSADAAPALARLPQEVGGCPLAVIASRTPDDPSPFAFNLSRRRALDVFTEREESSHVPYGCAGL